MNIQTIVDKHKEEFIKQAHDSPHREVCGLVVKLKTKTKYIPCKNVAGKAFDFEISQEEVEKAEAQGTIIAVFHSHVNHEMSFTPADVRACNQTDTPYILYHLSSQSFKYITPSHEIPRLLGRAYVAGTNDCFGLVKDYYHLAYGFEIQDEYRWDKWWKEADLITSNTWEKSGFFCVPKRDMQPGDILVMQSGSDRLNHLAVFIGNSRILHHCYNRLSSIDIYAGMWKDNTVYVLRNKECLQPSNLEVF